MSSLIERIEYEQSHITGKIHQVLAAIKNPVGISSRQLELLDMQYHAMELYSKVLDFRIADLKEHR